FARKNKILLVHDNPYSFILNDEPLSLLSIAGAKDCVVELNSLSKSHNMAGWRVGMLCGAKERIEEVLRFKSNMDSGMFLPVQLAA
ncbi:MAG TPA: aminotransferase class I/II-fold pyridoxal phosphate-dependent enzyme, partial [Chitinophagaceae bacterium]|nr:aminotransferase class I/II-fold pyridoxal phosphate-dependent enzyme [Chitinophagaceae bacterium]